MPSRPQPVSPGFRALIAAGLLLAFLLPLPARPQARPAPSLARAQELIDAGQPEAALPLLDAHLARDPADARALLLRSTARFLLDDREGGRKDLDRSLALDPGQRQAWLNRAALDLSEKRYDRALEALREGERLDPKASDNDLNIGAVLLLQGNLKEASDRFQRYLAGQPSSADAQYLVATNYAMAGYAALSVEALRRAIGLDERQRGRARTDANFAALASNKAYQELLATDAYRLPPGAHSASRTYPLAYGEDGRLLSAVVAGMRAAGERFDPGIESNRGWTLLWGDLRIKVSGTADGHGLVEASAPVDRINALEWQRRTDRLFRAVDAEVEKVRKALPKKTPKP